MKVILLCDVKGSGKKDDVINVSDGFARNYLFPRKWAVEATPGAVKEIERKRANEEKLERAISDVMQRRQMRSLRDKTQSRSRLLRRCLESIAPGVRQDAQRTGSGGEDEQQFLSGAAECTLFMLAISSSVRVSLADWYSLPSSV